MKTSGSFVKAVHTKCSVEKSQADIVATLNRYGASGFGFRRRASIVEVTFHLPNGGAERTVCIPIDTAIVHDRIVRSRRTARAVDRAQSERVAWRIALLWIDTALTAVTIGVQSIEEAFFAHLVVETEDGATGRMVDYVASIGGTGPRRLPAATRFADVAQISAGT